MWLNCVGDMFITPSLNIAVLSIGIIVFIDHYEIMSTKYVVMDTVTPPRQEASYSVYTSCLGQAGCSVLTSSASNVLSVH